MELLIFSLIVKLKCKQNKIKLNLITFYDIKSDELWYVCKYVSNYTARPLNSLHESNEFNAKQIHIIGKI